MDFKTSNHLYLLGLFLIIASLFIEVSSVCLRHQYLESHSNGTSSCATCRRCPPGEGVRRRCRGSRDTQCESCQEGITFSSLHSDRRRCVSCKTCRYAEVRSTCTFTKNTRCGRCLPGYFLDGLRMRCTLCGYCFPEHPGITLRVPDCVRTVGDPRFQCYPVNINPPFTPPQYDPSSTSHINQSQRARSNNRRHHQQRGSANNRRHHQHTRDQETRNN